MKKKIAACLLAAAMTLGSSGVNSGVISRFVTGNSIVAEAVNSADKNYNYTILDAETKTIQFNRFMNPTENLAIPSTIDGYTVTAVGSGTMPLVVTKYASTVTSMTIPSTVTVINSGAFKNLTALNSISIPSAVTYIAADSFENTGIMNNQSGSIKYVGNWLISASTDISSVSFNANTIGIAYNAFKDCNNLTSVTIPASVKYLCDYAFSGCTGLSSVTFSADPESIGEGAFYKCTSLTYADVSKLSELPDYLFAQCSKLSSVKVSSTLKKIGKQTFENTALSSFDIPSSVVSVGYHAFNGTPVINSQSGSNKYVGSWLVDADTSVSEAAIPSGAVGVANIYGNNKTIKSVSFPSSVKYISDSAFESCTNLSKVTFSDGLLNIGDRAFYSCYGLSEVILPNTLSVIGEEAFAACSRGLDGLTSISIPSSIASIGDRAFLGDGLMTNVKIASGSVQMGDRCIGFSTLESKNSPFTIYCYKNSTVYNYAVNNGFTVELLDGSADHVHSYTNWTVTKAATCTAEGVETGYCSCGQTSTRTISALGHTAGSWEVTKAATCGATGTQVQKCTVCGAVVKTGTIPKTNNHSYKTQVIAPTATAQGYTLHTCTVCGDSYKDNYTDPTGTSTTRKKGDVNNNGKIDASDLLLVKSHIKGVKLLTGEDFKVADVDDNGKINATDLLKMKAHLKGIALLWK